MKKIFVVLFLLIFCPAMVSRAEDYSFDDLEEYSKKSLEWGGYAELKYVHANFNRDSLLYRLIDVEGNDWADDSLTSTLELSGSYTKSIAKFSWLLQAAAVLDEYDWNDSADIFEAFLSLQPSVNFTAEVGKKTLKWGTGYAWNPVGFVQRPKQPNDPDLAREGFVLAAGEYVQSFSGMLKTVSFTPLLLPVYDDVNDDFGRADHVNMAARLYLLFLDTDIDFLFLAGGSQSNRFGVDFSRNINTNFEIHGEFAWLPDYEKQILGEDDTLVTDTSSRIQGLMGMRYLTENETTLIAEFYYNGTGYSKEQMEDFYSLAEKGLDIYEQSGSSSLIQKTLGMSRQGYVTYAPMREYFYLKISNKEPFDILYFSPSITAIVNLEDKSFTCTPELLYTGFENFEIRLRASLYSGISMSEYGEKSVAQKLELRLRYYF